MLICYCYVCLVYEEVFVGEAKGKEGELITVMFLSSILPSSILPIVFFNRE